MGQVVGTRYILWHKNDSIMNLINNPSSNKSLSILPENFANISKFFSGINNSLSNKDKSKTQNLTTMRFRDGNEIKVIIYALKNIKKNEHLAFD